MSEQTKKTEAAADKGPILPVKETLAKPATKLVAVENTREHPLHFAVRWPGENGRQGAVEQYMIPRGGIPKGSVGDEAFVNGQGKVGEKVLKHLLETSATVRAWHRKNWLVIVDPDFEMPKYAGPAIKNATNGAPPPL